MSRKIELKGEQVNSQVISEVSVFAPPTGNIVRGRLVAKALWDTGATHTQVSHEIAKRLGLKCIGERPVNHGMGRSNVRFYEAGLMIEDVLSIRKMYVGECINTDRYDIIIGMDIIRYGRFTLEGKGNDRTFTFEIPTL